MRIFLSAGHTARAYALPSLVEGFEADVTDGSTHVEIEALDPTRDRGYTESKEIRACGRVRLVGRPTGRRYRGLPWWEVQRED